MFKKKDKDKEFDWFSRFYVRYDAYPDLKREKMTVSVQIAQDEDKDYETVAKFTDIPIDVIRDAVIRSALPPELAYSTKDFTIKVVPKANGQYTPYFDGITLKQYTDAVTELANLQRTLGEVRRAYGSNSDPARYAEGKVKEKQQEVDDWFTKLTTPKEIDDHDEA